MDLRSFLVYGSYGFSVAAAALAGVLVGANLGGGGRQQSDPGNVGASTPAAEIKNKEPAPIIRDQRSQGPAGVTGARPMQPVAGQPAQQLRPRARADRKRDLDPISTLIEESKADQPDASRPVSSGKKAVNGPPPGNDRDVPDQNQTSSRSNNNIAAAPADSGSADSALARHAETWLTGEKADSGSADSTSVPDAGVGACAPLGRRNETLNPQMGLRERIGQMLVFGFAGKAVADKSSRFIAGELTAGRLGGVLFLKHNIGTAQQVKALAGKFAASATRLPALLTIDQEGGAVQRLGPKVGWKKMPSAARVAKLKPRQALELYRRTATQLRKWGFNVNFGPVADVNVNPDNPIIGRLGRSYSPKPDVVTRFGRTFVEGHRAANVVTSLKHFPGHGSSRNDSHKGFVDITKTWNEDRELKPFSDLIKQGCADMVMIGHLFHKQFQDTPGGNDPATFSNKLITVKLRDKLRFNGVVVTDDLDMGAIQKFYGRRMALIRAVRAGVDILLISNSGKNRITPGKAIDWIAFEARRDQSFKDKIEASYKRILALKQRLAWLNGRTAKQGR